MTTYLNPVVKKLTTDREIHSYVERLDSDKEILNYLESRGFGYQVVNSALENHYGVDFVDLKMHTLTKEIQNDFNLDDLVKKLILPYKEDAKNKVYYFAMHDIFKDELKAQVRLTCRVKGYTAVFKYAYGFEIEEKYNRMTSVTTVPKSKPKSTGVFSATEWVEEILGEGINRGASDIHIEVMETSLRVRLRIDGVLETTYENPLAETEISSISVRVKLLSGMDISEKRKAQDGRIDDYGHDGRRFDFRVSSLKTLFGEKIALRVIERKVDTLTFEELGFTKSSEEKVRAALSRQNGIVYLAGATGSGKTTTLYTMVDAVNKESANIYTIEDPIEKTLPGVNQIQLDELAGVTYPNTLKALLRQDPDIIVVGEIRDGETAELSIRASLTGHLVLATLHANNALDTLSRLYDMGIESYLVGASSLAFMSQRLLRKLCPECKQELPLSEHDKLWLKSVGVGMGTAFAPVGCSICTNGYKGRLAVVELVDVNDEVRRLITAKASPEEIRAVAVKNGFKSLLEEGIDKIKDGTTSVSEVIRLM